MQLCTNLGPWAFFPSAIRQRDPLVCHLRQPAPVQGSPWRGQAVWEDGPVWWYVNGNEINWSVGQHT